MRNEDFSEKCPISNGGGGGDGGGAKRLDIAQRTQKYVNNARLCMAASQLAFQLAGTANNVNVMYERVRQARDICETQKSSLLDFNTNEFGDQATTIWGAVDAMKSADNAVLDYIDTQLPSSSLTPDSTRRTPMPGSIRASAK